jgi:hypothetical protein
MISKNTLSHFKQKYSSRNLFPSLSCRHKKIIKYSLFSKKKSFRICKRLNLLLNNPSYRHHLNCLSPSPLSSFTCDQTQYLRSHKFLQSEFELVRLRFEGENGQIKELPFVVCCTRESDRVEVGQHERLEGWEVAGIMAKGQEMLSESAK